VARRTAPAESYLCFQKMYNAVKWEHSDLPGVPNLIFFFCLSHWWPCDVFMSQGRIMYVPQNKTLLNKYLFVVRKLRTSHLIY
jgi:hypothetical protein